MLKSTALVCLVVCQFALAINGELNEELEDKFLPYDRIKSEVDTPTQFKNSIDEAKLQEFKNEILPTAANVQFVEIEQDKNLSQNEQEHNLVILDIIRKVSDIKSIEKRAINPKYRAASMAFFGAILNNQIARRGKRSVEGFYKPSLRLLSGSYGYRMAEPEEEALAPQVAAPVYEQTPQAPQASSRIENTCSIGFSEPIHAGQTIVETYCRCPTGTYGIDCTENFVNPCMVNGGQYHPADASIGNRYFIECNWNTPYLFKCPSTLVWNQEIETCDWEYSTSSYSGYEAEASYGGY